MGSGECTEIAISAWVVAGGHVSIGTLNSMHGESLCEILWHEGVAWPHEPLTCHPTHPHPPSRPTMWSSHTHSGHWWTNAMTQARNALGCFCNVGWVVGPMLPSPFQQKHPTTTFPCSPTPLQVVGCAWLRAVWSQLDGSPRPLHRKGHAPCTTMLPSLVGCMCVVLVVPHVRNARH